MNERMNELDSLLIQLMRKNVAMATTARVLQQEQSLCADNTPYNMRVVAQAI